MVILNQCNGGISILIMTITITIIYKGKMSIVEYICVTLVM